MVLSQFVIYCNAFQVFVFFEYMSTDCGTLILSSKIKSKWSPFSRYSPIFARITWFTAASVKWWKKQNYEYYFSLCVWLKIKSTRHKNSLFFWLSKTKIIHYGHLEHSSINFMTHFNKRCSLELRFLTVLNWTNWGNSCHMDRRYFDWRINWPNNTFHSVISNTKFQMNFV